MKLLNGNVLYEFTVEQGVSRNTDHVDSICDYCSNSDSYPILRIVIRYRKFEAPIRRSVAATEQSLDLPLNALDRSTALMLQILAEFEVPPRIGDQMAEHFKFYAERLARRVNGGRGREIPFSVRLDEKVMSPGAAVGVRARMESARAADAEAPRRRWEEDEEEAVPAKRSSIEALEKVRVGDEVGGGRECAICLEPLEELREGAEAARMPCGHLYH